MRKRKNRKQRLLITIFCLVLCIVDVIPTGMIAWAGETTVQHALVADDEETVEENSDTESPDQVAENGETGEENPDTADIENETGEEIDNAGESLISPLAESEDVIASGSYTEDSSNSSWSIDKNEKLIVEGTGELAVRVGMSSDTERRRGMIM